jgi:hypothetical protein
MISISIHINFAITASKYVLSYLSSIFKLSKLKEVKFTHFSSNLVIHFLFTIIVAFSFKLDNCISKLSALKARSKSTFLVKNFDPLSETETSK